MNWTYLPEVDKTNAPKYRTPYLVWDKVKNALGVAIWLKGPNGWGFFKSKALTVDTLTPYIFDVIGGKYEIGTDFFMPYPEHRPDSQSLPNSPYANTQI